jgi:predicted nucleotidyltransferase component of viral defense system
MASVYKCRVGNRFMIPQDYIVEWGKSAPWTDPIYIEQDLIISRVLIEIFNHPKLSSSLAFRGGTALYKLFITPAMRYSEDIDLVQVQTGGIGEIMDAIKEVINPILGIPKWKINEGRATLLYKFQPESRLETTAKLKIEINTREHFAVLGFINKPFSVTSRWFTGKTEIQTYQFNELLGTKLRALYQRRKSRDLFDMQIAMTHDGFEPKEIVSVFQKYMEHEGKKITRCVFMKNLNEKMLSSEFTQDISPILARESKWDPAKALDQVQGKLLSLLKD